MPIFKPYYVREYRRIFQSMLGQDQSEDSIMSRMVGGHYEYMGEKEKALLLSLGLKSGDYLIDVGCGSGRLSTALRDMPSMRYLGTDVVPELLEYAAAKCARPEWRFEVVECLSIPEQDCRADMVVFFSVFTHLTPRECFAYLLEANRVLRPGGQIVVSFLDRAISEHRIAAGRWVKKLANRFFGLGLKNTIHDSNQLVQWGQRIGLLCQLLGHGSVGQAVCVYQKTLS
jgi:ubiquinone/menaquinone biosynthesis C-methylase UbiE